MRWFSMGLMIFVALPTACHRSNELRGTCAPIADASRAQVRSWGKDARVIEYVISDPQQIHKLLDFANARREVSQPTLSTMPVPNVSAAFFDKNVFVGSIGSGSNFFFVSCANWKGTRAATLAELTEFQRLIAEAKQK
jgi:hypothetical protein